MVNYFKLFHRLLEVQGVDFWWLDWQQGAKTSIDGLDPLFWLNHLHWQDQVTNPARRNRRPIIFSRWGGLGNHRYPIGFSGDTHSTWESVAFQPYFTATAGNVGYSFWSNDIGGHFPGAVPAEVYTRWVQLGTISPFLRTHSTKHPDAERKIWKFPQEFFEAMRESFHLRYSLIPYIYTAARKTYDTSAGMCQPLYYEWPELDEAYDAKGEYLYGDQMLAAPVTAPRDEVSRCALQQVWLPPGQWTHWFTGQTWEGPRTISILTPLNQIPLFVRGGGIVPTAPKMSNSQEHPLDTLILNVFPGNEGAYELYEDDGNSTGYQSGQCTWTRFEQTRSGSEVRVTVQPVRGHFAGMVEQRAYEVRLAGTWPAREVLLDGKPLAKGSAWSYDTKTLANVIQLPAAPVHVERKLVVRLGEDAPLNALLRDGLRGRLANLAHVRGLLGSKTPEAVTRALALQDQLGENPAAPDQLRQALASEGWVAICEAIGTSGAEPAAILESTARLLGLTANVSVVATGLPNAPVEVRAEMNVLEALDGLSGEVELVPPAHWKIAGNAKVTLPEVHPGKTAVATLAMAPESRPQTAFLDAVLRIRRKGHEFDVPLRETLFPSINEWQVIGPFGNRWEDGLDKVFPPETEQRFDKQYPGKDGAQAIWRPIRRTLEKDAPVNGEFIVDLHRATGGNHVEYAVAYAATNLIAPAGMDAVLAIGSDDGVAVWLNGAQVYKNHTGRPYTSRQNRVKIHLNKGTNALLLKISQGQAGWEFCAHVEDENGTPLTQVTAQIEPR